MNSLGELFTLLNKETKKSGSDYTGTVTRVEGKTAYVQITGADITDTPVSLSIDAKAGDTVRVRVANGRAWLTGNDTRPPTSDTEQIKTITRTGTSNAKDIKTLSEENERLKKRIKALEEVSTISILNQSTVLSNVKISKVGKLVTLTILDGSAQNVAAWTSLLNLDAAFAPVQDVEFVDTYGKKRMIISAAGTIKNIETLTSFCRGSVAYISAI